jgi:hypothetical protein
MKPLILFALVGAAIVGASCDPYYNEQIAALGGEAPNVRKGPLHRPGQPCLLCHDGATGNPPAFSVAGTVYVDQDGTTPAVNATVIMTNAGTTKESYRATTNAAGNFYVTPNQYVPLNPMSVVVEYGSQTAYMIGHVGRDGSCAGCHVDPAGPSSPGHIYANGAPPK